MSKRKVGSVGVRRGGAYLRDYAHSDRICGPPPSICRWHCSRPSRAESSRSCAARLLPGILAHDMPGWTSLTSKSYRRRPLGCLRKSFCRELTSLNKSDIMCKVGSRFDEIGSFLTDRRAIEWNKEPVFWISVWEMFCADWQRLPPIIKFAPRWPTINTATLSLSCTM